MERANPCAGLAGSPAPAEPEDPSDAVEERGPRDETGFGALAEAAEMSRPPPPCPRCGAPPARRDGLGPSGVRRRRRPVCGAGLASLTGTVLGGCKKPLATRVPLIGPAPFAVPPGACAGARRISRRTARERRRRLFAAVDGHRGRIVPRGRVRVGGTHADDADPSGGIRAGAQARAVQAEAVHGGGHRRPQGARRGGLRVFRQVDLSRMCI